MISVIILTFNSLKYIKPCLDSIFGQGLEEIEVIIVDNGSVDGTYEFIIQTYSQVKLIRNNLNIGSAKGRNQGIEISSGDWVLTMDCDVKLETGFFERFEAVLKNLPEEVGMVGPQILDKGEKTVYSKGVYLTSLKRFYDYARGKPFSLDSLIPKKVIGPCSAAAFYRRKMLEEIKDAAGYFDDRFFFLVEDVDLAWRANVKGWKFHYLPEALCIHTGDSSLTNKKLRQYLCFRNRKIMLRKNLSGFDRIKIYAISFPYDLLRYIFILLTNRYAYNPLVLVSIFSLFVSNGQISFSSLK